ncbi:hypothetical protein F5X96DRAFT_670348 [Biscogniauxia mediterranea]|nr:hypothetical protein F5X96DRAFT_670348 [Biscogniauxia mediterranea]
MSYYYTGPQRLWVRPRLVEAHEPSSSSGSENSEGSEQSNSTRTRSENGDNSVAYSAEGSADMPPENDSAQPARGTKRGISEIDSDGDGDDEDSESSDSDREMSDDNDQEDDQDDNDSDDADGALVVHSGSEARETHPRKKQKVETISDQDEHESASSDEQSSSGSFTPFGADAIFQRTSSHTLGDRVLYRATDRLARLMSLNRGTESGMARIIYPDALFTRLMGAYHLHRIRGDDNQPALHSVAIVDTRREPTYEALEGGRMMSLALASETALDAFRSHFENPDGADFPAVYHYAGDDQRALWREAEVPGVVDEDEDEDEDDNAACLTWTLGEDGLLTLAVAEDEHWLSVSVLRGA